MDSSFASSAIALLTRVWQAIDFTSHIIGIALATTPTPAYPNTTASTASALETTQLTTPLPVPESTAATGTTSTQSNHPLLLVLTVMLIINSLLLFCIMAAFALVGYELLRRGRRASIAPLTPPAYLRVSYHVGKEKVDLKKEQILTPFSR